MFWLLKLFCKRLSEEDKKVIEDINKLFLEYDVKISPRGGMSKTSKPEFLEKHRKEIIGAFPETRKLIEEWQRYNK